MSNEKSSTKTEWFHGRSVFITGASSGIGAALAFEFARKGARLALAARRTDRLDDVCALIRQAGGEAIALACDVRDRSSLDAAINEAVAAFGGLDVVVANAGYGVSGPMSQLSTQDYREQFETNVFGLIDTIYAAMPHLEASKGQIVLTASVLGRVGSPCASAYVSSKFAVCGLAESLLYEFRERGVTITCVEPGIVESEFRAVDNRGVYHEGVNDPAPRWLVMPARKAARIIVRGVYKRRFEVVVTMHGWLALWGFRHFPRTWRFLARLATRGRLSKLETRRRGDINAPGA